MSGEANIYLIGARASGKTTLGRRLAAKLKRPFVDTDRRVLLKTGRTVAQLVEAGGWEAFREAEAMALLETSMFSGQVVSCGGGIVLREDNRHLLAKGIVLYMQAPPEVLAERLARSPEAAQRPSLTGAGLVEEVRAVLAEREAVYLSCAKAVLPADEPLALLVELALAEVERLGGLRRTASGGPVAGAGESRSMDCAPWRAREVGVGSWKLEEGFAPDGLPQFLRELAQALESGQGAGSLEGFPADLRKLVLVAEKTADGLNLKLKVKRSGEVRVQKKKPGTQPPKQAGASKPVNSGGLAKGADAAARAKDKYRQLKKALQADYKALGRAAQDGVMPAQDLVESFLALCGSMAETAPPLKDQGGPEAAELAKANSAFVEAASALRRAVSGRDAGALAQALAGLERRKAACHAQFK